jgi:hypothetical protein
MRPVSPNSERWRRVLVDSKKIVIDQAMTLVLAGVLYEMLLVFDHRDELAGSTAYNSSVSRAD